MLLAIDGGGVDVEVARVEYDVEAAARAIVESDLPSDFAEYLRTGGRPSPAQASGPELGNG